MNGLDQTNEVPRLEVLIERRPRPGELEEMAETAEELAELRADYIAPGRPLAIAYSYTLVLKERTIAFRSTGGSDIWLRESELHSYDLPDIMERSPEVREMVLEKVDERRLMRLADAIEPSLAELQIDLMTIPRSFVIRDDTGPESRPA